MSELQQAMKEFLKDYPGPEEEARKALKDEVEKFLENLREEDNYWSTR